MAQRNARTRTIKPAPEPAPSSSARAKAGVGIREAWGRPLQRLLTPPRATLLARALALFFFLAAPFAFLPAGVSEVFDALNGRFGPLARYVDAARSSGVYFVPDGLAARSGEPFELALRFPKLVGQTGRLKIHNAALPGLADQLIITDPTRPGAAPPIDLKQLFVDFSKPITLDPLRPARAIEVHYRVQYRGAGMVLVLNQIQLELDWFALFWPCLGISLALGALARILALTLRPASILFPFVLPLVLLIQSIWWRLGWSHVFFVLIAAGGLMAAGWVLRTRHAAEVRP